MPRTSLLLAAAICLVSASLGAQDKPLLTPKDFGKWESIAAARSSLSPNGTWLAYTVTRQNEENELRVRGGARDTTITVTYGLNPVFTADSRWVAYLVGIPPKERDRLTKEKKPVHNSFAARNLETGETIAASDVTSFAFSADGKFVAMTKYAAEGKKSSEVLVNELSKGTRLSFSNISESNWNDSRPLLAMTVLVDGNAGNGVQLYDGRTGAVHVLESTPTVYRGLAWRAKSEDLAVLRAKVEKEFSDTAHVALVWMSVGSANPVLHTLSMGIPTGARLADYRRPSWSKDGSVLYVGLRKREPIAEALKKSEDKVSDVEVWNSKDVHLIPEQRSSEQRDLRATTLAAWNVVGGNVVQIGTDAAEQVTVLEGDHFAVETDRKPFPFGQMFGRHDEDLWLVDITNGTRKKLLEKVRFEYSNDPTGRRVVTFDGKDYWAVEIANGARTNLTARLTGAQKIDFVDREDDHPTDVLPPIGAPAWNKDGSALLVNGAYDVWSLTLDGSGGKRLTDGAKDGVVHRIAALTRGGTVADRAVDFSKPVYLSLYGRRTKKSGYARIMPNGTVERLVLSDASVAGLFKADSAERYAFVRQSYQDSPNLYEAGTDLSGARVMTATNTFQKDYAWGKVELMDFTSTIGKPLQALLYYPANYDPKKKYPMIVYTYELLTQGYHNYIVPRENDYYNTTVFTQNGYFVLLPDIVFRPREPGLAVLQAVEPAVKSVLARGLVDPARVGHVGHSQGGYEAYFLATHSKLFATAVAGSGISDMISFAGQMHWSSVPEFDHWETGQFRMQVAPWEDMAAMVNNSPLAKVNEMPAKSMLMEIGGEDPTVDMRQGVEFYNYARRAGKNVVLLLYPGEGHSLGKKENAIDYERRILQWFGHYLKGDPAPKWITDGQSWVERKAVMDANKDK